MLDKDLAALYETEVKAMNLAIKRSIKRFHQDLMFQLFKEEFEAVWFQIETLEKSDKPLRLQNETLKKGRDSIVNTCPMLLPGKESQC